MLIEDKNEYKAVWNKVYEKLKFAPSCSYRGHSMDANLPFQIEGEYAVYGIENMTGAQIDLLQTFMKEAFVSITQEQDRMYALDWQHSAFLFNPREEEKDEKHFFPSFYPDGDYYFFIDRFFKFGYLGHPWRQEVWIFGDKLLAAVDGIYHKLGWEKIRWNTII